MGKKKTIYSEETKAAVMAALLAGQSVSSVAKEHGIPRTTVSDWLSEAKNNDTIRHNPSQKKERIGELLIGYLDEALTTLSVQARFVRREEWLEKQEASQLAILHGVISDKTIRILEAITPEPNDGPPEESADA